MVRFYSKPDGTEVNGFFIKDYLNGKGTWKFADGNIAEGKFKNDLLDGYGNIHGKMVIDMKDNLKKVNCMEKENYFTKMVTILRAVIKMVQCHSDRSHGLMMINMLEIT